MSERRSLIQRTYRRRFGAIVFIGLMTCWIASCLSVTTIGHHRITVVAQEINWATIGAGCLTLASVKDTHIGGLAEWKARGMPSDLGWHVSSTFEPAMRLSFHHSRQILSDAKSTTLVLPLWPIPVSWTILWALWIHRSDKKKAVTFTTPDVSPPDA